MIQMIQMIQRGFLTILGAMIGLLVGFLALLLVVFLLIKGAIQKLFVRFGPKKTAVVATMALVFLSVATANAGNTTTRIEGGNLVYYQKTKEIPNVPSGITAEQAQQLVDGVIPSVKLSAEEAGFYFGLPIAETRTDTIISFRGGWITEEVSSESLSVFNILVIATFMLYAFFTAYTDNREASFAMVIVSALLATVTVISWDATFTQVVVALGSLSFISYLPGRYLRRMKEKRHAMHALTAET